MKLEDLTQEKLEELLGRFEALEESNKGLKADLAKAKAKAKGAEIDPEEHAALQTQVAELTDKLNKTDKTAKSEIEKLSKSLAEKDSALTTYLLDAGLTDALAKQRVRPELMDAAKALLRTQATIKADGGNYQAVIGDKPLTDYVKEWSATDSGKHFVLPDGSSGGGAGGGSGGKPPKETQGKIDGNDEERAAYFKSKFPDLQTT